MIAGVSDAGFQQLRRHEVTPSRLHSEQLRLIPKTSVTPKLLVLLSRSFIGEAAVLEIYFSQLAYFGIAARMEVVP